MVNNSLYPIGIAQRTADFLVVMVGFALGYWFYHLGGNRTVPYTMGDFLKLAAFTGVLFLIVFQSLRLYEHKVSLLNVVESRRLLVGWVFGSLVLFTGTFYFRFYDLSRLMISYSLLATFVLLNLERSIFYQLQFTSALKGKLRRSALIYGAGVVGRHLYKRIYHSPGLGIAVVGFLDDDQQLWGKNIHIGEIRKKDGNIHVFGGMDKLAWLVKEKGVKEIYVALPNAAYQKNMDIVQACKKMGINVSVVPPTYGHQMHNIEVEDIGGIPILKEKESRPYFLYPFLKRIFDITVSLAACIVLSPIFIVLALLVKFDSPGPIIFRQKRVGTNGKEFDFLKFRTMHVTANPYAFTPQSAEDPRITRFGRWLRRSSLDELPQFWNVLKGEMSIVGPRPEMPFIVATYNEEQKERLKVKPGITGVWQISAVRGEPIHINIEYDLFYIEHRSMLLDLIIMIKTIATAIRGIGAV